MMARRVIARASLKTRSASLGVSGAGAFAARLAARRAAFAVSSARLPLPLVTLAARFTTPSERAIAATSLRLTLAPRIDLAVSVRVERDDRGPSRLPGASQRLEISGARPLERRAGAAANLVVAALRAREQRHEAVPGPGGHYAPALTPADAGARAPRMPLAAPRRVDDAKSIDPHSATTTQRRATITPAAPGAPRTLPPAEVARITDDVLRSLDHRIAAQRERLGRR